MPIATDSARRLTFQDLGVTLSGKTHNWLVVSGEEGLGNVKWFGHWRRYAFYPRPGCVFDPGCLREIADFCEGVTNHRKMGKPMPASAGVVLDREHA